MRERNVPLTMIRPTLSDVPGHDVPAHHAIRPYAPGDELAWLAIQRAADRYNTIDPSLFAREFGGDLVALRRRIRFLVGPSGEAIGTAAAWFGEAHREGSFGRVHWVAIQRAADRYNTIDPSLFAREFGDDVDALQRRLSFLVGPSGEAIGTAAAWFGEAHRPNSFGRVHWVAIHPSHQGRGLAKGLLHHVCVALRELGHRRAYLTTSSARIAAITLYLRFGFVPEVIRSEEAVAWAAVAQEVPGLGRLLAP